MSYSPGESKATKGNGSYGLFSSWIRRIKISVKSSAVLGDQSDFPVLIDEKLIPDSVWDVAINGGGDIRVCSDLQGVTRLPLEVVNFDTSAKKCELWLPVDILAATDVPIYLFAGRPGESQPARGAAFGLEAVWDSNFVMVHHLQAGSLNYLDSTSNHNDVNAQVQTTLVDSIIGKGRDFDNSLVAYLNVDSDASLNPTAKITMEQWINVDTWNGNNRLLQKGSSTLQYMFRAGVLNTLLRLEINGLTPSAMSISIPSAGTNHYAVGRYNGSEMSILLNGVKSDLAATGTIPTTTEVLRIGGRAGGAADTSFNGILDEVRISNNARSENWLNSCYVNQKLTTDFLRLETAVI